MKFGLKDKKRIFAVLLAVITMGLTLSFLIRVDLGTDPCTTLNLGVANQLGISFGTWQVIFNALLFIIVILYDRSQIGWGTLANMLLIGYSADFFTWLFDKFIPADFFNNLAVRIIVLIPTLIIFIIAAAVYMAVELGAAPYDATVFIIASKVKKIPFRFVRMAWDIAAALIGFLLGSTIGVVTVVMAFALGPVISLAKEQVDKYL